MKTEIEYNDGFTAFSSELAGVYGRGKTEKQAITALENDVYDYCNWLFIKLPKNPEAEIIRRYNSELKISEADSDILLESEKLPINVKQFDKLKEVVIQSAFSLKTMYDSFPDVTVADKTKYGKTTFYGNVPNTPEKILKHVETAVTDYYAKIFDVKIEETEGILSKICDFTDKLSEKRELFANEVFSVDGEQWTLSKLARRLIWHARIHAKAMYRLALRNSIKVTNSFSFDL